jgi:hypothetical protein
MKLDLKYKFTILWYFIEIYSGKLLNLLNIRKDTSVIPKGPYCYVIDEERNKKEPITDGYWTKNCKYYRSMRGQCNAGCTYVGFIGWDICLGDQCKICGENEGYE